MTALLLISFLTACVTLAAFFLFRQAKKGGERNAVLREKEQILDDVARANKVRDRVRSDPDYRDRVRKAHTRS
ncbi:MAG: hypothetical protein OXT65_08670 [Alphaproteobacteria bacterium]|nr:hypothetical protein [Alphaproteobacteria bacterium]